MIVFVGLYTYFCHAASMKFVPWQEGLIEVSRVETIHPADGEAADGLFSEADEAEPTPTAVPASDEYTGEALILNVSSIINGFHEHVIVEDDGTTTVVMQAVSTNQGSGRQAQSYYELTYYPVPDRLIYGFEQPQKLLWGTPLNGGAEILPRLALSYYLMIAAALAVLCGLAWVVFRKWDYSWILRQLFFAPVSYVIAHFLIKGIHTPSFFLEHDLISIALITIALYALFSLSWQIWLQHKKTV